MGFEGDPIRWWGEKCAAHSSQSYSSSLQVPVECVTRNRNWLLQVVQFLFSLVKLSDRQVQETHEIHRQKSLFRLLTVSAQLYFHVLRSTCRAWVGVTWKSVHYKSLGSDSMLSPHILMFTTTCPAQLTCTLYDHCFNMLTSSLLPVLSCAVCVKSVLRIENGDGKN
jgi:hypothetical protein